MGQDLAANQGVAGCRRDAVPGRRPAPGDGSPPPGPWTWRCTAAAATPSTSAAAGAARSGLIQDVEEVQERADVEGKPMIGDPAADGHTDRGDAGAAQEHSRLLGMHLASKLELLEHRQDRLVQPIDVSRDRQPAGFEGHDQVGSELAREMEDASTPSVDPVDLHPEGPQVVIVGHDVSPASRSAHADRGWMLAEDQAGSLPLAQLVDEPPLELLDFLEVDERRAGRSREGRTRGKASSAIDPRAVACFSRETSRPIRSSSGYSTRRIPPRASADANSGCRSSRTGWGIG